MTVPADIPTPGKFLADIEEFIRRHEMAPTTFSLKVMNNPAFLFHLREGRSVTLKTARRVYDFIRLSDAERAL